MAAGGLQESVPLLDPTICRGVKRSLPVEDTSFFETSGSFNPVIPQKNTILNINADKT
jgi:hypothetical protein